MKIKDWVYDNVSVFYDGLSIEDDEGMYAIGTCGRRRYWSKQEDYQHGLCSERMEEWLPDDGCIRWEEKLEHT